jgi:tetratricopeptide (TPR) repeat protein
VAYGSLGQYDPAIKDFNMVINLDPEFTDAYYNLAVTLQHTNLNKAFDVWIKYLEVAKDNPTEKNGIQEAIKRLEHLKSKISWTDA